MELFTAGFTPVSLLGRLCGARLVIGIAVCSAVASLLTLGAKQPAQAQETTSYGATDIPEEYLWQYRATADYYGLDWTILAGIGKVESDHGRIYTEGCIIGPPTPYGRSYGPMQFLVSSWEFAAVDGNGDGIYDSCDYRDAIPSTANYLIMHGAPEDYYGAIYSYNPADWYVQWVLTEASNYAYYYGY